jgi:hypothetical protein
MSKIFLILFLILPAMIKAQGVPGYGSAPSTEVKLFNQSTEKQSDLEEAGAKRIQKKKLGGFGGVSFTYELEGEKSAIRLNADSAIFVIKQGSGVITMDLSMTITLYKLEVKNGKRVAVQGEYKSSIIGSGKTTDSKIITSAKQLKEGLTQLLPQKKLEKGEYAFISSMMEGNNYDGRNTKYIVYAFGID